MVRTKKRYEALSKLLVKIRRTFPDTKWSIYEASKEINDIYGNGFLLSGRRGIFEKEFFILMDDPRRVEWAAMINGELESEVKNASR